MNSARLYQHYIWLISTLRRYRRLTLAEIQERWLADREADGEPLTRPTFNRYRDAILDMFGVIIECDLRGGYHYYISNPNAFCDDTIERWMLSTLTVSAVLADSAALQERIILENVPAGEELLPTIIRAIKTDRRITIEYQRFGGEAYEKTVAPYALKYFHRRWYLLAFTGHHYATYSLDRMRSVVLTGETFRMPDDFSPQEYFSEYFGVLTDETPLARIVIRAYGRTADYLRTLPLHDSQREVGGTADHADFELHLRPTGDFVGQLLAHGPDIEVISPDDLRQLLHSKAEAITARYEAKTKYS